MSHMKHVHLECDIEPGSDIYYLYVLRKGGMPVLVSINSSEEDSRLASEEFAAWVKEGGHDDQWAKDHDGDIVTKIEVRRP